MLQIQKVADPHLVTLKENFTKMHEVTKNIRRNILMEKLEEKKSKEFTHKIYEIEINYKETTAYPTKEDCLVELKRPPYFPHIIKGPYSSTELYLNNMFHLLKEDYMIGIRNSFRILM